MTERRGLGRGLSALLDEATAAGEGATAGNREIPIEQIHRNAAQPRMDFDVDDLEVLTDSVRERGILQPILVRPSPEQPGQYQIVAGERRWRAAQAAGLTTVPVVLRELDQAFVEVRPARGLLQRVTDPDVGDILAEAVRADVRPHGLDQWFRIDGGEHPSPRQVIALGPATERDLERN